MAQGDDIRSALGCHDPSNSGNPNDITFFVTSLDDLFQS